MNEETVNEAPAEAVGNPRPRWRGNRARVGVLAAVLGIIGAFLLLSVVAPPTVEAATLEQAVLAGAVTGGTIGGIAGTVVPGLGNGIGIVVGAVVGSFAAGIGYIMGGWGQGASAAELSKFMATDQTNQTKAQLELGKANAENVAELAQRANYYYERAAYNGAATLYQHQTEAGDPHIYDSDYVLDKALVSDEMVGSVAGSYADYDMTLMSGSQTVTGTCRISYSEVTETRYVMTFTMNINGHTETTSATCVLNGNNWIIEGADYTGMTTTVIGTGNIQTELGNKEHTNTRATTSTFVEDDWVHSSGCVLRSEVVYTNGFQMMMKITGTNISGV